MKGTSIIGVALLYPARVVQAEIVAQWNFTSRPPDGSTSTGALSPSVGLGTAIPIGGITSSFSSGSAADPEPDNTAWHTTSYPGAATNNRTAGVQFSVDTSGYTNVWLSWAQRHSDTASRYCRLLYTVDGYTWLEGRVIEMTTGGVWSNVVADLGAVAGAANNPAFGFQIVTEFESTATGAGPTVTCPRRPAPATAAAARSASTWSRSTASACRGPTPLPASPPSRTRCCAWGNPPAPLNLRCGTSRRPAARWS